MDRYTGPSINAWPSFADLMLSVVLVLVIILVAAVVFMNTGTDLSQVAASQAAIRDTMEQAMEVEFEPGEGVGVYDMTICTEKPPDVLADSSSSCEKHQIESLIQVTDEPLIQRITFRGQMFFETNKSNLTDHGESLVEKIGESIVSELPSVREVQIHGHADLASDPEVYPRDESGISEEGRRQNLRLASDRALTVFDLLKKKGVDPVENLMSAASYGPYHPVNRRDDQTYSEKKLKAHNLTKDLQNQNRRIELRLYFSVPAAPRPGAS